MIRNQLLQLRDIHGADTPIGHRCSNVMEQLEHFAEAEGEQKMRLGELIERQISEIEKLKG